MSKGEKLTNYHAIIDNAPDGIYVLNSEGNFLLVNEHFCQALGYSREELLQMNIQDTYLESELDLLVERVQKLRTENKAIVERSIKRKDGSTFYAQISVSTMDDRYVLGSS